MDIVEIILSTCLCLCVASLTGIVLIFAFLIIKELIKGSQTVFKKHWHIIQIKIEYS